MDVDRMELELYLLGEVDPERVVAIEHAIQHEHADTWRELQQAQQAWKPEPLPVTRPAPARRPWFAALAVAAAVLMALAIGPRLFDEPELGYRSMGTLPMDVFAERDSEAVPLRLLQAGDTLGLQLAVPRDGFVAVGLVQEQHAELLWVSHRAESATSVRLPAGLELDGYTGEEWLVVSIHETLPDPTEWGSMSQALIRTGRSDVPARAIDVTRGRR
jgi:hypothetical protein